MAHSGNRRLLMKIPVPSENVGGNELKRTMGLPMGGLADPGGKSHEKLTGPNSEGSQQWKIVPTLHHGCKAFIHMLSAMQVLPKLAALSSRRFQGESEAWCRCADTAPTHLAPTF